MICRYNTNCSQVWAHGIAASHNPSALTSQHYQSHLCCFPVWHLRTSFPYDLYSSNYYNPERYVQTVSLVVQGHDVPTMKIIRDFKKLPFSKFLLCFIHYWTFACRSNAAHHYFFLSSCLTLQFLLKPLDTHRRRQTWQEPEAVCNKVVWTQLEIWYLAWTHWVAQIYSPSFAQIQLKHIVHFHHIALLLYIFYIHFYPLVLKGILGKLPTMTPLITQHIL